MTSRAFAWTIAGLHVLAVASVAGCAVLQSVTPADRAQAYAAEAKAVDAVCKAYAFDRSKGLVPEVPAMSKLCE